MSATPPQIVEGLAGAARESSRLERSDDTPPRPFAYTRFAHLVPAVLREAREYRARQWSRAAIEEAQRDRLKECLTYALARVPAYRTLGISAAELDNPYTALGRFPILSKPLIQQRMEDFVTDDVDPESSFKVTTSGSTGVPLEILHDEVSLVHECASFHRVQEILSIEPGDRVARVVSDRSRPMWRLDVQLLVGPMEVAVVNLLTPEQQWCEESLDALAEWEPVGLFGNPSDLLALSLLYEAQRRSPPPLRFALTGGENLAANTRRTIEFLLRCKVHDVYSMQEGRQIAWECGSGSLHVDEDRLILESLETPGGGAELVVTFLRNPTMPLIRYRTGDLGLMVPWEKAPCACGRKLATLADFFGRDRGFIVLPGNRFYSPKPIKLYLTSLPLATWQLIQREPDRVELLVIPRGGADESLPDSIRDQVHRLLGGELVVEVRQVEPHELLAGDGKFQMMHLSVSRLGVRDFRRDKGERT